MVKDAMHRIVMVEVELSRFAEYEVATNEAVGTRGGTMVVA